MSSMIIPVATERLITTNTSEQGGYVESTPISPLPDALERTIKIPRMDDQLGINVEVVDSGVNGVIVTAVANSGAIPADGRIQVGDYIISVNNESLRNTTNTQARAILKKVQLFSKELR